MVWIKPMQYYNSIYYFVYTQKGGHIDRVDLVIYDVFLTMNNVLHTQSDLN